MNCPLCEKNNGYLIHEFPHSSLYLGEHQFYKGYCVLVTKKHYKEMTDMPRSDRDAFFQEMMITHMAIQRAFNPDKMNLESLGNVVPHIHWHFFPRYKDDAQFQNPPFLQMEKFKSASVTPEEAESSIKRIRIALSDVSLFEKQN